MFPVKKLLWALVCGALLAGCAAAPGGNPQPPATEIPPDAVTIRLSDEGVEFPAEAGISIANDIIYYEEGHDESYGEGEPGEAHSAEEAAAHTVVHIRAPGTYVLTGKLSAGQIAVDLGEGAKDDPGAVVTLVLDNAEITCSVAPAILFYNVYECGDRDKPTPNVDTSAAGANVILADYSWNQVKGSHVAKIYQPGTEKKLHKYDAALYSRMSMNLGGGGFLDIIADNEGLDSELHLTVNSGTIAIRSGNDGINTNEDGVSVTTINGGTVRIEVTGETGEGDGIDSNGWLVINGGNVFAHGCGTSGDAGIDSDMGIHLNGGTVIATGNMLDRIEEGGQTHAVFQFAQRQEPGVYTLKNAAGDTVLEKDVPNPFGYLLLSAPELTEGTYTLWSGDSRFQGIVSQTGSGGFFGDHQPIERPDWPGRGDGDVEIPPQPTMPVVPQGQTPENMPVPGLPEDFDPDRMPSGPMPQGGENMPVPDMPGGVQPPEGSIQFIQTGVLSTEFPIRAGANYFSFLQKSE